MARKKSSGAHRERGPSFEEALGRLEGIVRDLEESEVPLEKSLALFEEGVRLSRLLHERLNEAERTVQILLKDEAGAARAVPFGEAEDAEAGEADEDGEEEDEEDAEGGGEGEAGKKGGRGQTRLF